MMSWRKGWGDWGDGILAEQQVCVLEVATAVVRNFRTADAIYHAD